MAETSEPIVGIDLGTTYSVLARLDESGRPVSIPNIEGEMVTPSVLFFEDNDVIVGKEAVKAMGTEYLNVAECAKRDLGQREFHKEINGQHYPPEVLQAWILRKLRNDSMRQLGEYRKVVITVPAYFDEVRRKATQDAGYIAGFEVMDIINEPTAAAVAYGFGEGYLTGKESAERKKIIVYDLGGGTFDVTVMEVGGRDFVTLATDGDMQLGGRDWDQRMVDYCAEEYIRKYGLDPREDPNVEGRLWRECEDAKRTLSARSKASVAFEFGGNAIRVEVTRDEFHAMTRDLLDRTAFTTRQTLQAAGLEWGDIDRILLVGGSSRMPAVSEMLKELSGMEPDRSISPDDAVAHGAALHAGLLMDLNQGKAPAFTIRNVNSHSLGVVGVDPKTKRPRTAILIPRNTPIPAQARRIFKTQKKAQQSILIQIVEGESSSPEDCTEIGKCSVRDLPADLAAQTPVNILFQYSENGRLTVDVRVQGADRQLRHKIVRDNSLSQKELDRWRSQLKSSS
ncbi:MAG: Hsp70 family protein [Pirellulaceae bacterium]|nr:Hsp70 family protein [Planctomycetaceae bacterium]